MDTSSLIMVLIALFLLIYVLITNKSQAYQGIKLAGLTIDVYKRQGQVL